MIAHARFLVGMRLHSIIYAICTATPMVIVNYSAKVKAMAKLNGLDRYLVDVDDMDENKLKDKISLMLAEETLQTEKLQKQRQIMREKEQENKKLVETLMEHSH